MDENTKKEEFSYGYIQLLCSSVGLSTEIKSRTMDNQGIDMTIYGPGNTKEIGDVRLDVQIKCTSSGIIEHNKKT